MRTRSLLQAPKKLGTHLLLPLICSPSH
uniref:Uncharacterized protein n=1 Tax=Arundo donax TaxID=35708 RepID=A0A0A9HL46_ARUDO